MAWARRGIGALVSRSDLGPLTVPRPAGVQTGDILVMVGYHSDKDGAFDTVPSDASWTQRHTYPMTNGGRLQLWTKMAGPLDSDPVLSVTDWTTPDTYDCAAYMVAYSGLSWAVPDGGIGIGGGTLPSWGLTPVTTSVANDLVLVFGGLADALATWVLDTPANVSGFTEFLDSRIATVGGVFNMQTINSSFEQDFVDANGWSVFASGCGNTPTWSRTATNAVDGSYAGRLQYTAAAGDTAGTIGLYGTRTGAGSVVPGQQVAVGFNLRGANTGTDVRIGVRWYDLAGNYLNLRSMGTQTINNTSMDRYTKISSAAPANTSQCMIHLLIESIANGDSLDLYFDCAQIEMGDTANDYGGSGGSGISLAGWEGTMVAAGSTGSVGGDCADYTTTEVPTCAMLALKASTTTPPPDTPPDSGGVYAYTDAWKVAPPQVRIGSNWYDCGVLCYASGRWVPVISPAVEVPDPTDYYNAMTDGDPSNHCHNDGAQSDTAHLDAQAAAALSAGKALYLPGGTGYLLSTQWNVPQGLLVFGDGPASSKLLGKVRWRSNVELRKLRIGAYTDSAAVPYSTSTLYENIVFRQCRLRGGVSPVVNFPGGIGKVRNISFLDTQFEVPHTSWSVAGSAHEISLMGDSSMGSIIDKVTISRCHFGVPNDYAETVTQYGHCLFYMHNMEVDDGYINDINITDSTFELSYQWGIDFALWNDEVRDVPTDYPYCRAYVARNEFRGSGAIRESSNVPEYPWTLDIEPCVHSIIEDNVFWPASASPVRPTYSSRDNIIRNNVFDYRQDSGVDPYMPGDYWNNGSAAANYMIGRQIYFYSGANNEAYGNRLYLPVAYAGQQTNNGWIIRGPGDTTSTWHDNYVYFGGDPGDIDD